METNPFHPPTVSKRESKAAENPGFPFLFGEGMEEKQGRRWTSYGTQLHLFLLPLPQGAPALAIHPHLLWGQHKAEVKKGGKGSFPRVWLLQKGDSVRTRLVLHLHAAGLRTHM